MSICAQTRLIAVMKNKKVDSGFKRYFDMVVCRNVTIGCGLLPGGICEGIRGICVGISVGRRSLDHF